MNLNNLKIGQRLAIGFGALLALMVIMFAAAFLQLLSSAANSKEAEEFDRRAALVLQWTSLTELNVTRTLAIAKAAGMPQVEAHFGPQMKDTSARISEIQKELDAIVMSDKGKALMAEIGEKRTAASVESSMIELSRAPGVPKSLVWLPIAITSVS